MKNPQLILLLTGLVTIFTVFAYLNVSRDPPFVYNEPISESIASFSMASYCSASKLEKWNCGAACKKTADGLTDVYVLRNKTMNAGGLLGYSPKYDAIAVIFRGTVPWLIKNWMSDLDFIKVNYPYCANGCKVHRGFFNSFKELQDQVETQFTILRAKYPHSKVFVGGHSLGAAMSNHAVPVIYKLNNNKPIDAFYNFGSPRVGDDNYSDWFDSQHFASQYSRVTHYADPVPHLPPEDFGFEHIGDEVYYKSFKKAYTQCLMPESKDCADGVLVPLSIPDHLTYYGWDWATAILACQ